MSRLDELSSAKNLIRLGSQYGGWYTPKDLLISGIRTAVCVGAGEDISYDLILSSFSEKVFIFDPTPKACIHVGKAIANLAAGHPVASKPDQFSYNDIHSDVRKISFMPIGVHEKTDVIKFYPPPQPDYASYSTENIQNTLNPVDLPVVCPNDLAKMINDYSPDILKLDIEGAELPFLNSMISSRLRPALIQVELDFLIQAHIQEAKRLINSLEGIGYRHIHQENRNSVFRII